MSALRSREAGGGSEILEGVDFVGKPIYVY